MTIEQLLFCLAVFGNLILFYYTLQVGCRAIKLVRSGDRFGALCKASAASALAGLTVLLPWTLLSGDQVVGKLALVICLLTPFVVSEVKLLTCVSGRSARARILIANVATVGMVVVFVASGNWAWFWSAAVVMAVAWIAARKLIARQPQVLVACDVERQHDGLGTKPPGFWRLSDPNDPSWTLGHE